MNTLPLSIHHEVIPTTLALAGGESSFSLVKLGLLMLVGIIVSKWILQDVTLPGVPELKGIPILGAVPMYLIHGTPHLLGHLISIGKNGISYTNLMGNSLVSIHDPAMTKEVLMLPEEIASREGNPNTMRCSPFTTLRRLIGDNLFSYAGPETSQRRNLFMREFMNTKSNAEKFDTVKDVASWHVDAVAGESQTVDIDDIGHVANNYAVSMWGDVLYGNREYYLDGEVLTLSESIMAMASSPWSSIWQVIQEFLGLVAPGGATRSEQNVRDRVDAVVGKCIKRLEDCERNDPEAPLKTMRNLSVKSGGERTGPLSKFAADFANLNFFGGHHSVGSIATWTFIELDRHPECLAKLMAEIDSFDDVSFTDINSHMPYLDAVVMEINRLYPVVHATLRIMHSEATLTSGKAPVVLKPEMLVYISFMHLQTSEEYWGADAKQFVPERFVGGHNKEHPLLAFGYGPRNCVGYKFALLALKLYLVQFLKTYTFELKEHDHEMRIETLIETNKPVAMQLTRRS